MKIDYSPRASGKTTRMIEWLQRDRNRVMITISRSEVRRLQSLYPDVEKQIVSWEDFQHRHHAADMSITEVGVDNVDIILQQSLRLPVKVISMTYDENEKYN